MTDSEPQEAANLRSRIRELESENERLEELIQEAETQLVDGFESELEQLRDENVVLEERIVELESSMNDTIEQEIECLRDENDELMRRLEEADADMQDIGDLRAEIHELHKKAWEATGEDVYVASFGRHHFHRPSCHWLKYVPPHRRREFSSHEEAVAAGLKPCKTCRA